MQRLSKRLLNPICLLSLVWVTAFCPQTLASEQQLIPVKPATTQNQQISADRSHQHYHHHQHHSKWQTSPNTFDFESPQEQELHILPSIDVIIKSVANSRWSPTRSQRGLHKENANTVTGSHEADRRRTSQKRQSLSSSPPVRQLPAPNLVLASHQHPASLSSPSPRNHQAASRPIVHPLDQLQSQVIPIDAISQDIESAIQKIVQDIVNRRDKIFYQLPNLNTISDEKSSGNERRSQRNQPDNFRGNNRQQDPVFMRQETATRHSPPNQPIFSSASSASGSFNRNPPFPYYERAGNGLGPGLKSLANYVKSLKSVNRGNEQENEGYNYLAREPNYSHQQHSEDNGEQEFSGPESYRETERYVPQTNPNIEDEEVNILPAEFVATHIRDQGSPSRTSGRQFDRKQTIGAPVTSGNNNQPYKQVPDETSNLTPEQIRINNEVLLPLFESLLSESNNKIGIYIPDSSITTTSVVTSHHREPPSHQQENRGSNQSPPSSFIRSAGSTGSITTSYSSKMKGIRKKVPCPGR